MVILIINGYFIKIKKDTEHVTSMIVTYPCKIV